MENNMENLRKINGFMGIGLANLNINYDEEDAEFFDEIMTSKVRNVPKILNKYFKEAFKECPEELLELSVGELLDYLSSEFG